MVRTTDDPVLVELEQLLFRVSRQLHGLRVTSYVADAPVDRAGLAVLGMLDQVGDVRLSDLAPSLGLDISTVSRQVRHLEEAGLVARTADPDDKRASRLQLSRAGRRLLDEVRAARRRLVAGALAGWSRADRDTLARMLARLADDLGPELCVRVTPRQETP